MADRSVVLASGSRYRLRMLVELGWDVFPDAPNVDERALDADFQRLGPHAFALALAHLKADAVAVRQPSALLIAADQVGVLSTPDGPMQLTKRTNEASAVSQLMAMSGTTHELVNAVVVCDTATGRRADGVDVQRVTMRSFDPEEAGAYVRRFEPYDTSGSYRLEDQDEMAASEGFVIEVDGEHDSGVLGLPLPLLDRLMSQISGP